MKIRKLAQEELLIWGLLYILFISHGTNIISFSNMTIIFPITILILLLFYRYKCTMTKELFILFVLLFLNHLITGFLSGAGISKGFNFSGFLEMVFVILTAELLYNLDNDIMTKFIKIVYFFSCISLICYFLVMVGAGRILTSIFAQYNTGMGDVAGKLFYVYNLENPDRNAGIFTEPGVYQVVLVMCLYVIIFLRDRITLTDKQTYRYLFVLFITLITAKSAAGYVGLLSILIGILLKKKEKKDLAIVGIIVCVVVFLIYNYYTMGEKSILEQYFFGKLVEMQERNVTLSSGGARLVAMRMGWEAAITHPFGIGYLNWENQIFQIYGHQFGTGNALFTQLGTRGFIAFFISLYLALKPAFIRKKGWIEFGLFFFLFLYIAIVQSKILYPAIVLVAYLPDKNFRSEN